MSGCIAKLFNLPKTATPPKWDVLFILAATNMVNVVNISYPTSFMPSMVLFFGYSEADKGYYCGLIGASQFAGRVLGSIFWGWLADFIGRRKTLIWTISLSAFLTLLFGFSTSVVMACTLRFFLGLANGMLGVCKVIVHDISDSSNQALTMSSITVAFGAGAILSPLIGGWLSQPIEQYPNTKWLHFAFLHQFPFILPSLVVFLLSAIVCVLVLLRLPETRSNINDTVEMENSTKPTTREEPVDHQPTKEPSNVYEIGADSETRRGLLPNDVVVKKPKMEKCIKFSDCTESHLESKSRDKASIHESISLLGGSILSEGGFWNQESRENRTRHSLPTRSWNAIKKLALFQVLLDPKCAKIIVPYSIFSMGGVAYYQLFPVWQSTPEDLNGLCFHPRYIGLTEMIGSTVLLFTQVCFFTFVERRMGSQRLVIYLTSFNVICYQLSPQLYLLSDKPAALWPVMELLYIPSLVNYITILGAMSIMINNSVSPHLAGTMNGLSITCACIFRSLGPLLSGAVYSWSMKTGWQFGYPFDHNAAFLFISFTLILAIFLLSFLPESLNKRSIKP